MLRSGGAIGSVVGAALTLVICGLLISVGEAGRPPVVDAPRLPVRVPDVPPPTEHWLGEGAEARNSTSRKAWMRAMHRAPPDVDPALVERDNGLALIRRRNGLSAGPPPPDAARGAWVERGSANQAGRVHVALEDPRGDLVVGSAKGGLWRRDVSGWAPFGDNLYGGAHHLVAWETESGSIVYLAATDGGLVHRTDDGGRTWRVPAGVEGLYQVKRLVRPADREGVAWLIGGVWEGRWVYTLHRTTDYGRSFQAILKLDGHAGDIWTSRTEAGPLYLARDGAVLESWDDGTTFSRVGALPGERWTSTWLAGSEAGAPRLWAVAESQSSRRLFRSDDAGGTWVDVTSVDDWWGTLAASTVDPDLFAWGGVEVHVTEDGARFRVVNTWGEYYQNPRNKLHADIPGIDVVPDGTGGEVWYISTDGGLYESSNGLRSVQNLSLDGLRISQYYDVLTSSSNPAHVAAGSQDQGYQSTQRRPAQDDDLYELEQVLSGDYGHLTSSDGTHAVVYSVYPGFVLVASGESEASLAYVDFPADAGNRGWMPPVVADPREPLAFFWASQLLYRYEYQASAATWIPVVWSDRDFAGVEGEYISALTFSPVDPDRGLLATSAGRLFFSRDGGRRWTLAAGDIQGQYFYGQALLLSGENVDLGYAGGSGYGNPAVLRTTDGGETWEAWDDGLPDTLVYGLAEARDGSGRIFAGTESSAWMRRRSAGGWEDITGADAPITTYWSVEVLAHENTARFATYGRGIWDWRLDPEGTGCVEDEDRDRDGVACDLDCDDDDADRRPGVADPCDGIDQDCDPATAPNEDQDGDGFFACADCDDRDALVHPRAEERRGNDVDEDCDGEVGRRCGCADPAGEPAALSAVLAWLALRRRVRRSERTTGG